MGVPLHCSRELKCISFVNFVTVGFVSLGARDFFQRGKFYYKCLTQRDWFAKPFACLIKRHISPYVYLHSTSPCRSQSWNKTQLCLAVRKIFFAVFLGNWGEAYLVTMLHDYFDICQAAFASKCPLMARVIAWPWQLLCVNLTYLGRRKFSYIHPSILSYFLWTPTNGPWLLLFTVQTDPVNPWFLSNCVF